MKHFIWISLVALLAAPSSALADYWVQSRTQADGGAEVLVQWDTSSDVEFRLEDGVDEARAAAVEAAFQTWEDVECADIAFARGDDIAEPQPRHWMFVEGEFIQVWWVDDPAFWESAQVGRADWVHDGSGRLIGADIILNSKDHSWSTTGEAGMLDVQSVVTALIGKSLGIESDDEASAVFGRYSAGDTSKRTLGPDDIAAVQYLYNDGSCTPTEPADICPDDPFGSMPCGPEDPDTSPADGGTSMPRDGGSGTGGSDAGVGGGGDGAVGMPGDGDDDGGCSVSAAGGSSSGGLAWLAVTILLGLVLRRRR